MRFESLVLSEEKVKDITARQAVFGQDWVKRSLYYAKAKLYIEQNLLLLKDESKYGTPFNCCHTGDEVYCRQDSTSLTQDDIDALSILCKGQENRIIGKAGDMKATHHWFCDSGD